MKPLFDVAVCLRFFTRLPLPRLYGEETAFRPLDFATMAYAVPLAGLLIGAVSASLFWLATLMGFGVFSALLIALICELVITGALHEDGLADVCDALGARDAAKRLDILRDSRIGTYGTLALMASLALRLSLMNDVASSQGHGALMTALVAGAAVSRAAMLMVPAFLSPARPDGLGRGAGQPSPTGLAAAVVVALLSVAVLGALTASPHPLFASLAGLMAAAAMLPLMKRSFGGFTGDIIGATQQVSLLAFWLAY